MKKLGILSILVLVMTCLFAVSASAVEKDITNTGLAVYNTDDEGTYKAGDGTVTVSFEGSSTCKITINNATIDLGSSDGYAIVSPANTLDTTVTITGNNRFIGTDAIKVETGSITLEAGSSVTGGSFTAESFILESGSSLNANIVSFNEGKLTRSSDSTVNALLAERHDYGGAGGYYNTVQCVGNVEVAADELVEVALLSMNDFTFADGATLTLNGELRNGYGDIIEPETMKTWLQNNPISGYGLIQIGQDYADYYATDGEQIPGMLTLTSSTKSGRKWRWNASTKTLTLEDGFRCMEEIEFKVSGDITVIVKGKAFVGEDFETDGKGIIATVTIKGPGTLTVYDEFEMSNNSRLSLIIAEGTTVITKEEVEVYSLTVNGTFEVSDNESPLIEIVGGTLTVGKNGALRLNNTNPEPGDVAILFSGATSPDGLCNIPGTTLVDDGDGNYILADKSGKPFVSFGAEPEEDGVPNVFLLMFMKRMLQEYTVTLTASEGGSITGADVVRWSRDAVYTITPDEGYTLAALYLDGEEVEPTLTLTLDRVKADRTIEAVFAPIEE